MDCSGDMLLGLAGIGLGIIGATLALVGLRRRETASSDALTMDPHRGPQ